MLILIVIDVHIYRKLFLALKEVRMVKITPQNPPAKFVIPPPPQSLYNSENPNFEKMKKMPGDIIILQKCMVNDNHIMYGS